MLILMLATALAAPKWQLACESYESAECVPRACTTDASCGTGRCMEGQCYRRVTSCEGSIASRADVTTPCEWLKRYPAFVMGTVVETKLAEEPLYRFDKDWQSITRSSCSKTVTPQLTLRVQVDASTDASVSGIVDVPIGGMQVKAYGLESAHAKDGSLVWGEGDKQKLGKGDRIAFVMVDVAERSPVDQPILVRRGDVYAFEPFASNLCATAPKPFKKLTEKALRGLMQRCSFDKLPPYPYKGKGWGTGAVCQ